MKTRRLGKSGLEVSVVGLGCNNFGGRIDLDATRLVVDAALDRGITLFDTADAYGNRGGSESLLGEILGERRKNIVLATKFGLPMGDHFPLSGGASRRYIVSAVEASLRRLKTDWIDLYQLHRPDPETPIEETLRALDDLVAAGKIRYIGASKLAGWQLVEAEWSARQANLARFISHQDEYSLLSREIEREVLPAARAHGLGLLPYFPLAGGLLTGKYRPDAPLPAGARLTAGGPLAERFLNDANWKTVEALRGFAASRERSLLDLAFAWLLAEGAASVIAGATRPDQVAANVQAGDWTLTAADLAEIDRLLTASPGSES